MPNFPTSLDDDQSLYVAVNNLRTELTSNITNTELTIPVTTTSGYPNSGFITILSVPEDITRAEAIRYEGVTPTTFSGTARGAAGTPALAHFAGDNVDLTVVADHHNELKDAIIAIEEYLGVTGSENFVPFIGNDVLLPGNLSINNTLTVSGGATFCFAAVTGTLDVAGDVTFSGNLQADSGSFTSTVTTSDFAGDSISISSTAYVEDLIVSGTSNFNDVIVTGTVTAVDGNFSDSLTVSGVPVDILGAGGSALTVREVDGSPSVGNVDTILVSNGTLTDDGGGQVTITTGGGGSLVTPIDFSGALVSTTSGSSVAHLNQLILAWENELQDTDGYYDAASPNRLTVPSGLGINTVILKAQIEWDGTTTDGMRFLQLVKNGSVLSPDVVSKIKNVDFAAAQSSVQQLLSYPLSVTDNDFFELRVTQANGSTATIDITATDRNWFAIENVTPKVDTSSPLASGTFRGALVSVSSGTAFPSASATTLIGWDQISYDTDGFFDSNNPSVFTIPANVNKVKLHGQIAWEGTSSTGDRRLIMRKNDSGSGGSDPEEEQIVFVTNTASSIVTGVQTVQQGHTAPLTVTEGDFFDLRGRQDSGGPLDIGPLYTWFGIEVVDPLPSPQDLVAVTGTFTQSLTISGVPVPLGGTALTVEEQDGTPSVSNVSTIKVPNDSLTDEGSGIISLDFATGTGSTVSLLDINDFSGAVVTTSGYSHDAGTGLVTVTWTGAAYDTDGYFDISEPSRLTVVTTGIEYVVLKCQTHHTPDSTPTPGSSSSVILNKNGSALDPDVRSKLKWGGDDTNSRVDIFTSYPIPVNQGDYFEVQVSEGGDSITLAPARTWFAIEDVTPRVPKLSSGFRGAYVTTSSGIDFAHATNTTMLWDTVAYDTDNFHDPNFPERLSVPDDAKKVQVFANLRWDDDNPDADGTERLFFLQHRRENNTVKRHYNLNALQGVPTGSNEHTGQNALTPVVDVEPGDYFLAIGRQRSGTTLSSDTSLDTSFFSIEIKDPSPAPDLDNFTSTSGTFTESLTISGVPVGKAFRGAFLTSSSGNDILSGGALENIAWDTVQYDTSGFFDPALASIRIPAGVSKVRLSSSVRWETNTTGIRQLQYRKNESTNITGVGASRQDVISDGDHISFAQTAILDVAEGDEFKVSANQDSGVTLEVLSNILTWFQVEALD